MVAVILLLLLILPGWALSRLIGMVDPWILAGLPVAASVFAYFAQRSDKGRAKAGAWRIPEATLHFIEFLGGWPGSFLAQQQFRHKTAKGSYQAVFWLIVIAHQAVAFDSLHGWRWTKQAAAWVTT